ncbi:alpha/beta-hydrolase [Eremomyces bilateralis CBS 781.70]|uniref:Alpha/beta-hydrolase n=1 Tax=Eremomyces bilateralis CBS 781.70 TaxID=1392243 RepID=A0A6G1GC50_9PEZI|nr:alpha/beta-hydrolase [Eremomyces bilateralis CBS 781.70]KAF1815604.1 alpha/beta-hydrolase [Eremomyces bilateralis CBS 781.70]
MSKSPVASPASPLEEDDTSSTLTLPDGRKLGYAQFGSPTGRPVILLHGLACSRFDAAYFHEVGQQLDARVIGVDRPGMGWSSAHPTRTLLDFVEDVEHLIEHLKLDDCSVIGVSGGGPSALACAKVLPPTKLKAVAIIVGLGPPDIGMSGARLVNRIGFPYGFRYCPPFLNRWFWQQDYIGRVDLSDEERLEMALRQFEKSKSKMPAKDLAVMSDHDFYRLPLRSTREGFAQGFDGVLLDGKLCCLDFGFKVEDIRPDLPVHLWYGKQDVFVPANHGVQLEKRLGSRAHLRLVDETHVSLLVNRKKEILENLIKAM